MGIVVVYVPVVGIEIGVVVEVVEHAQPRNISSFAVSCTAVSAIWPASHVSQLYFMAVN